MPQVRKRSLFQRLGARKRVTIEALWHWYVGLFWAQQICQILLDLYVFTKCESNERFSRFEELSTQISRRQRLRVKALLEKVKTNPARYQFAIDDTLVPHSVRDMWGVYSWFDHTNKSYIRGHKILVLGIVDKVRNVLIPAAWDI